MSHATHKDPIATWGNVKTDLLTWDDLDAVLDLLRKTAPGWSAELNQASPDESTIVIVPEGANDLIGPAFVLHRANGRVHLDQFRWDEYRKLGDFRSLDDALTAMRARMVPLTGRPAPEPDFNDRTANGD